MKRSGQIAGGGIGLVLGALVAAGCGSEGSTFGDGSGNGNGNGNGDDNGNQFIDPNGNNNGNGNGNGDGDGGFNECAASNDAVVRPPVDLLFVIDVSYSMPAGNVSPGKTKWDALKEAMGAFVSAPQSAGLSISLRQFPRTNNQGQMIQECTVSGYRDNEIVSINALPGHATTIVNGLNAIDSFPTSTPTRAALEGVIAAAKARQAANPDRSVNIVFFTDGVPTSCLVSPDNYSAGQLSQTTAAIRTAAAAGLAAPNSVRTYALGLFAPGDTSTTGHAVRGKALLDAMAESGGTTSARVINADANSVTNFINALNAIRSETISCTFPIPTPATGEADPNKVNVRYTPSGRGPDARLRGVGRGIGRDQRRLVAEAGTPPTQLTLCPVTCNALKNDPAAQIGVVQGCKTSTVQPPAPPK